MLRDAAAQHTTAQAVAANAAHRTSALVAAENAVRHTNVPDKEPMAKENAGHRTSAPAVAESAARRTNAAAKVRQRVGDDMIIGVSAHTVAEALEAVKHGADYLGSGAVFGSATKTNVQPMSRQTLADICAAVDIPVVAIGGISKESWQPVPVTADIMGCPFRMR